MLAGRREAEQRARRAERERREAEARAALLERILDTATQGVLLMDRDGRVALANAAARRLLGAGMPDPSTALPELALSRIVTQVLETEAEAAEERDVSLPQRRRLRVRGLPFDGGAIVLVDDISDVYRALQVRRDFIANVSHELRTPVSGVALLAEHLRQALREDPDAARRFAATIATEADRLARLVADLLDLSRIEGDLPLAAAELDAGAILEEAAARVSVLAAARGVTVDLEAAAAPFVGDALAAATAVTNLLDNAVRYSPQGGRVRARVEASGDDVTFAVEDDGPGIPSGDLDRIFERFYRVDKARARETGGTGLGLAIVKHVAERHGGRAAAESELGSGSRFTLTFPRRPA